jgi:hypothetical protein
MATSCVLGSAEGEDRPSKLKIADADRAAIPGERRRDESVQ